MKVVTRAQNTSVQFRFREVISKVGRTISGSTTKTITYQDFDEKKFWFAIEYLTRRFSFDGMKKKGIHINVVGQKARLVYISDKYKFDQFKKELLAYNFIPSKTLEEELSEVILAGIPEQVCLVGGITYRQTWETPEEREEVFVDVDKDGVMEMMNESIEAICSIVYDLNNNEGEVVEDMQRCLDRGDYE